MSSCFPLKANAEVRAVTFNPGICARALMISSARPSLKYSCSLSPLMLTNGSTAIDGCGSVELSLLPLFENFLQFRLDLRNRLIAPRGLLRQTPPHNLFQRWRMSAVEAVRPSRLRSILRSCFRRKMLSSRSAFHTTPARRRKYPTAHPPVGLAPARATCRPGFREQLPPALPGNPLLANRRLDASCS